MAKANKNKNGEIGFTGLVEYSGQIREDFLKEFHGQQAYKRFNEMRLNNATIGSGLLAIEQMIRGMSWEFIGDEASVEFLNEARDSMSQSWNDFISEVLSFVWAGFSLFEIVYQKNNGAWTWRKFAPRGQDTVYKWLFDDEGGLAGFTQLAAPKFQAVDIPIESCILFRTRNEKNNPEGRSLLRIAWTSYYYLKNLQQIEAIGFERDVNGLPVIKLPENASTNENDTNSDASKAAKIVRNMRVDEQAGLVLPFGWDAVLMNSSGKSFDSLANAIERYEKRIATAFFSQFLLLGQDGVGSLALSQNTTDFFMASVNSIADIIAETFTKYAVYRLLKLNGATDEMAREVKLTHTPASAVDIQKLGAFIGAIKDVMTWDENDEMWLRQLIGAPEPEIEDLKMRREDTQEQKRETARAFADRMNNPQDNQQDTQQDEPEPRDDNTIELYAADNSPDDKKRRRMEKQMDAAISKFLQSQQRRILKAAREMSNAKPV